MIQDEKRRHAFSVITGILIGFAVLCFVTAAVFDLAIGFEKTQTLPSGGGTVGPIQVAKDNTVLNVIVEAPVANYGDWRHIEASVLDANEQYLYGFGDEVWKETGSDDEGTWYESKNKWDIKLTFEKGTYFLDFDTESGNDPSGGGFNSGPPDGQGLTVTVMKKLGSAVPHFMLGILAMIAGVILFFVTHGKAEWFENLGDDE